MSRSEDGLVTVLLEETGDRLHVVVEYDGDEWEFLFVRDGVRNRIEDWETQADELVDDFRREAQQNAAREQLFDVVA